MVRRRNRPERLHDSALQPGPTGKRPRRTRGRHGYFFGDDVMAAAEKGRWVEFILLNPAIGRNRKKHTWVVRRDGLIFGSGWYEE